MGGIERLIFLLCLWASIAQAQWPQSYHVKSVAPTVSPLLPDTQLVVLSATRDERELLLRVGIFNAGTKTLLANEPLRTSAMSLTTFANGVRSEVQPSTATLDAVTPPEGLPGKTMNVGLLAFRFANKEPSPGTLELRVPMFRPVFFTLDNEKRFAPIDWTAAQSSSVIDYEMKATLEQLAIIPLRVKAMTVKNEALEFSLTFRNASRFPITWKAGGPNGRTATLHTDHAEHLRPLAVSDSLEYHAKPKQEVWEANTTHKGWVRFPLPHPHAAQELRFDFPGYPPLWMHYNSKTRQWDMAVRTVPANAVATKVDAVLAEEQCFADIKAFWKNLTRLLGKRDFDSLLHELRGEARKQMQAMLVNWQKVPFASYEYSVLEHQRVKPSADGTVKGVQVELRYTLATLPKDNVFVATMTCDMHRLKDGSWVLDIIHYPKYPPFWLLGYSHLIQSEHFMVFHRALPDSEQPMQLALKQLEKAYARLSKSGLPLKSRYVAFIVGTRDDFEKLTNRNPNTYSGAASSGYETEKGKIAVINQALYINDYRFYVLQRMWGKQDRQTTIQHELVHLALADFTRPWTPPWLVEGIAMFYAEQCDSFSRTALRETLTPNISLMNLSQLTTLGANTENPLQVTAQYQLSGETVVWLEKKYGEAALIKLYAAFAQVTPEEWSNGGGTNKKTLAAAQLRVAKRIVAATLDGLSLEQLDAVVRLAVGR